MNFTLLQYEIPKGNDIFSGPTQKDGASGLRKLVPLPKKMSDKTTSMQANIVVQTMINALLDECKDNDTLNFDLLAERAHELLHDKSLLTPYRDSAVQHLGFSMQTERRGPAQKKAIFIMGEGEYSGQQWWYSDVPKSFKKYLVNIAGAPAHFCQKWCRYPGVFSVWRERDGQVWRCRVNHQKEDIVDINSVHSPAFVRKRLDEKIQAARNKNPSDRTSDEKVLAGEPLYFVGENGRHDSVAAWNAFLHETGAGMFDANELDLMHSFCDTDASANGVLLSVQDAIDTIKESQNEIFASNSIERIFIPVLEQNVAALFDASTVSFASLESIVDQLAQQKIEEVVEGTGFAPSMTFKECHDDQTMEQRFNYQGVDAVHQETCEVASKICMVVIEKYIFLDLVCKLIRSYPRPNGHIALWTRVPQKYRKFRCIGGLRRNGFKQRVKDYNLASKYIVDLASGDLFRIDPDKLPMMPFELSTGRMTLTVEKQKMAMQTRVPVHGALGQAFDPRGDRFDVVQRFCAFRAYVGAHGFVRPRDNCVELTGDTIEKACKTDWDHMCCYSFNSIWVLWRAHHAVNMWFHQIRLTGGSWYHPYHNEPYHAQKGMRSLPGWYQGMPKTAICTLFGEAAIEAMRRAAGEDVDDEENEDEEEWDDLEDED